MPDTNLSSTLAEGLTSLRGSTTEILIALYKFFMHVPNIPNEDPVLKRAVVLDTNTATLSAEIEELPKLPQNADVIKVALDKLKAVGTVPAKQNFEIYSKQLGPLEDKIKNHTMGLDEFLTRFQNLIVDQHEKVRNLLFEVNKSKDPLGMSLSQPIQREIANQETQLKELRHKLNNISKNAFVTESELNSLHRLIYNALPPAERKTVVSPEQISRTRMSMGRDNG